ncbi:flagellar hook-basal body complex protein FliE [Paenibacillus allorhizosphaerae]|uniref:Flagellar hook-basal body complex protein FliE n=1 Tax=Paenibacillus allorhizosphaerae TaxID=2849866 RepID=A0ABN7THZ6_9BACL|nr:flagellar hook-basal body complex protein FliE [Paenibacillus allorhizosphaerae]CAG7623510.1 Flagellar hook-basal body complex protein FliE [Paenibacillus allorhizosphaerae]
MIDKLNLLPAKITGPIVPKSTGAVEISDQFGKFLGEAIADLNSKQKTVDVLNDQFVKGDMTDVHQMMIATERASLGLELTVQVRNKVIEAYQEIMRMQV